MVKKVFFLLPFMLLLFNLGTNALAAYEKIFDQAQLFIETERTELNDRAMTLSEQAEMDIVIVTTDDSEGKSSSEYARDFYEEHGFGYEGTLDGILYLLNMDEREVYIFTRDKGAKYIDANRVEELLDEVYPPLGEEQYGKSADIFLKELERMIGEGVPIDSHPDDSGYSYGDTENVYPVEQHETGDLSWYEKLGIYLLISFAIGGITIGTMAMGNRGRSTVNARTYLQDNSFTLTRKHDQHYNTIVTQQKIPKANNNSGGSSFTGGSGGGIGGGGRKF